MINTPEDKDELQTKIMRATIIFLRKKKEEYEQSGYIPTLELLIDELEEKYDDNS